MNFPRNIYMKPKEDGSVYWVVEKVLYEGVYGYSAFIHCTSEQQNDCTNCTFFSDCNRLREHGERLLKEAGLCNTH